MKVLLFAYACSPTAGSEGGVGWKSANALAAQHEVHVIAWAGGRKSIEESGQEGRMPESLKFHFVGKPPRWHPNRMIARLQSWNYYRRDLRAVLPLARELHARERFDLSHHVTYASWRLAPALWKLPIPFVWGPVGGGETVPREFGPMLSLRSRMMETARRWGNSDSFARRSSRLAAQRSAVCIAANSETLSLLQRLRGSAAGTARLLQVFFTQNEVRRFEEPFSRTRPMSGPLRIFAGGNLDGGKGVRIALEALAIAQRRSPGFQFHYTLGGHGSELAHLQSAVQQLGLHQYVTFHPGFKGGEYLDQLGQTNVYLLPSLRDSAGTTLMEAMLAGCAPIVVRRGGPGEIVTGDSGWALEVGPFSELSSRLAERILEADRDRARLREVGFHARERISTEFTETRYRNRMEAIYAEALADDRR